MAFKLYLDPGHGGSDPGAAAYGIKEKDIVLDLCKRLRDYLRENYSGIDIKMSRTGDTYPTLAERTNEANAWGADAFLSVHINAGGGSGFETYVYPGVGSKTKKLQDKVHSELMRDTFFDFRDRGQKSANFHVLRESHMPALLTENLFIDTKKDADFLKQSKQIQDAAANHAHGIAKFAGLKKKKGGGSDGGSGKTKYVEVLASSLWVYDKPDWNAKYQTVSKGEVFTIKKTITVDGSKMHQLKSGLYITDNQDYVRVYTK